MALYCGWDYKGSRVILGHWGYEFVSDDYTLTYIPTYPGPDETRYYVKRKVRARGQEYERAIPGPSTAWRMVVNSFVSCGHEVSKLPLKNCA